MSLRKEAKGRECQVRIPGVCNGDNSTVVLAHYRKIGVSGFGMKAPDLIGSWACSSCHDAIDRRAHSELERDYVRLAHADGVMRTIKILLDEGKIGETPEWATE